ncbi:hypothetical protein [Bordetella genomosp. 13]|uniref:hypothetical protein n=1 Tax=Bordetella genomosp. 13 TaxID=463040 RepID=UPI0011AA85E9|nr:hypothetical protein [Bordetella genomosp. 13]
MTKPVFHADTEQERHNAQPDVQKPQSDRRNPNPYNGSGYPAGGQVAEQGKDAYGRTPAQRRQAGLPEELPGQRAEDDKPGGVPAPERAERDAT